MSGWWERMEDLWQKLIDARKSGEGEAEAEDEVRNAWSDADDD